MKFCRKRTLSALLHTVLLTPFFSLAQAADESLFLSEPAPRLEQSLRAGHSAMWTLPNEATQYRPAAATPVMRLAMQAQTEGRYLEAVAQVDKAEYKQDNSALDLLRASLYLQGSQAKQAEILLVPLRNNTATAADAYALSAMAALQQGKLDVALADAEQARAAGSGSLPALALTYALQAKGRLAEARAAAHALNAAQPGFAIGLAREAELSLTQNDVSAARQLIEQARSIAPEQPYVVAVSGLVWLIGGQTEAAKSAFQVALKRDPMDAKALMGLGLAEVRLGHLKAGLQALQNAHESDPENAMILTYLGRVQQQLGQTEQARSSWRQAQQADANDPTPWLYLAQAQLQANQPVAARDSLRQAQARSSARAVYRGDLLLQQDALLLQANLAEVQRQLGLNDMAFQTLADSNSNAALALRDQADILQSTRFGQSARRSLVLQSLFNEQPGALPVALDVYGDGAGETGAATPQNGVVSSLTAQKPSYNDYGALFSQRNTVQIDSVLGSRNTGGEQVRAGVGSDTLGVSLAQQYFTTDGFSRFNGLDNRTWQGVVQWRPVEQMQAFVLYEDFKSNRGYVFAPADVLFGTNLLIRDRSKIARLGARYSLNADDEVRVLLSQQRTGQLVDYYPFSDPLNSAGSYEGSSRANAVDVQYRTRRFGQPLQLGAQIYRSDVAYLTPGFSDFTRRARQVYISSQQTFNPQWQLDWSLGWGQSRAVLVDGTGATTVQRVLPRLGVVYTPDTATHIRLAAWQGIGMRAVGDADLAPVSVAGIVQTRPSDAGKLVRAAALALDRQLGSDWLLEAQAQTRKTFEPAADGSGGTLFFYQKTDVVTAGMHWQPHTQSWTLGVSATYEKTRNDENALANDDVDKQTLRAVQLDTRWFISPQWRAQLVLSRNWVAGYQQVPSGVFQVPVVPTTTPYGTVFNQADVAVVWQLPQRLGQLQLGVRNLGDTRFQYTDPDPLTPRFSIGRLVYGSMKLMW